MSNPVQSGPFIIDDEGVALIANGKRIPVTPNVMLGADGNVVDPSTAQYQVKDGSGNVLGTSAHPFQYSNTNGQQYLKFAVTGKTGHTANLVAFTASVDMLVTKVVINVRTVATGSALLLDVGTTPTSLTTASDNLLDGINGKAATGLLGIADQAGVNGKAQQILASGSFLTAGSDNASNDVDGFVGDIYVFFVNA